MNAAPLDGHVDLLVVDGEVVQAGLDVLVVEVDLLLVERRLAVQPLHRLPEFHQLRLPVLAIPPLVPDVLNRKRTGKKKRRLAKKFFLTFLRFASNARY